MACHWAIGVVRKHTVTALGEACVASSSDSGSTPLASTTIHHADIAQLVEHFTRNEGVAGSNPVVSTK